MIEEQKLTELDKKLREMAILNWTQFTQLVGPDAIRAAKVCLLRQNAASYGEIGIKLSITKEQVRYACAKCEEKGVC
jgi:hypothetical protein